MIIEQGTKITVCLGLSNLCNVKGGEGSQRREAQCALLEEAERLFPADCHKSFLSKYRLATAYFKGPE